MTEQDENQKTEGGNASSSFGDRPIEHSLVIVFCAVNLIVPPFVSELYPFSAPTMFARRVSSISDYTVLAPGGEELSNFDFMLQHNNPHDPPVTSLGRNGYGRTAPKSVNEYSIVLDKEAVSEHVAERLSAEFPELRYVTVSQKVTAAIDDYTVGEVSNWSRRVYNPRYQ